jgi:hypothetical protein
MQRDPLVEQPGADNRSCRNQHRGTPDGHQIRADPAMHSCRRLAWRGPRHSPSYTVSELTVRLGLAGTRLSVEDGGAVDKLPYGVHYI